MHYAVTSDRLEMIGNLVASNVDIDVRDTFGATPLHLAVKAGRERLAITLLEAKVHHGTPLAQLATACQIHLMRNLRPSPRSCREVL